jgi:hypothetical protein
MTWLLILGATLIAFLLGGLVVAEYLYRRGHRRDSMPWADDVPAPPRTFKSES